MTKVIFELNDQLEEKFRQKVVERKGLHKGVIKAAFEEATLLWLNMDDEEVNRLLKKYLPKGETKKK